MGGTTIEPMEMISGTVHLRPVRLGFVGTGVTTRAVREAARLASGVWGGIYFPFLDANDPSVFQRAEALALDVLHPLDDAPETTSIIDAPGFRWRGGGQWGPFGKTEDPDFTEGLLPIDRLVDPDGSSEWDFDWDDDDLASLYDVWFGYRQPRAEPSSSSPSPSLDDLWSTGDRFAESPIAKTAAHIEYSGNDPGLVVVIVGKEPEDLVRLWNLRAAGGHVQPWVVGKDAQSLQTLEAWLGAEETLAHAHHARRGDGTVLGPLVSVVAGEHEVEVVTAVCEAIERFGFTLSGGGSDLLGGWRGHHPLMTSAERDFNLRVPQGEWQVDIALPILPIVDGRVDWPGIVAADVVVHREPETSSGGTLSLPAVRPLARVIDQYTRDVEQFHRPSGDGRVVGVQGAASTVRVALIPGIEVFRGVLPDDAAVGQSDDGRFITQFVARLGGVDSSAASQPAVREVFYDLSRAERPAPMAKLIQAALNARGSWPDRFTARSPEEYARSVGYFLANTGLLVPTVSVRCPQCATDSDASPDELAAEMRCALCLGELNLGLALALQGSKNPWRYRLAAHLPPGRIRSGLATMAANTILRTAHRAGAAPATPHIFGLTVELQGWECEIDIAALIMDGPLTLAVVGELKGGRELIDETDIDNLQRVQHILRSADIEAFLMAGTTRNRFEPSEVSLLRTACEAAPTRLMGPHREPALPIVLCGPDVSKPWFDEDHPWRWGTPGGAPLGGLAEGSCRRNLGLQEDSPSWNRDDSQWSFHWESSI